MLQSNLSERLALVARIAPQSVDAATVNSTYVGPAALGKFARLIAIAQTGENSTGDVTIALVKASDDVGTNAEVFATADAMSAAAGDEQDVLIDFDTAGVDPAKPYVALRITVSDAACLVGGVILAGDGRDEPVADKNAASVNQVVS